MKKNILTIGCSNLLGMHHAFRQVFQHTQSNAKETETDLDVKIEKRTFTTILEDDYARYTNLSTSGAGNGLIKWRLFDFIENERPDYVYLQFSGLTRRDFYFDIGNRESFDVESLLGATSKKHLYVTGGNQRLLYMVGGNHPFIENPNTFEDYLKNLAYNFYDDNTNNWHSLQDIFCAISVLDKLEIQYNWSIYYDPINPPTEITKMEGTIEKWPDFINNTNKLPSPLNYTIDSGVDVSDGVHFTYDSFVKYLEDHKSKIHLDFNHK